MELEGSLTQYFLVSAYKKTINLIDLQSLKIIHTFDISEEITSVLRIDENKLIFGSQSSLFLSLFDPTQKQLKITRTEPTFTKTIHALGCFYKQKMIVTGSGDGTLGLFKLSENLSNISMVGKFQLRFNMNRNPIWKIACFVDSGLVLLANDSDVLGAVRVLFDSQQVVELDGVMGLDGNVSMLCWNGRGNLFASSCSSKMMYELRVEDAG